MISTNASRRASSRRPSGAARFGYAVAVLVNGILLWVSHQLLVWGWPGFLTDEFEAVLPLLSASLVAGMVVNALFVLYDQGRFRALGDAVTSAFGLSVTMRMWSVFPFSFEGYARDWTWLVRVGLALGVAGTLLGLMVALVKLVGGSGGSKPRDPVT